MISVEEAREIVRSKAVDLPSESISFQKAVGRVLDEDILADRDFPPFNRVAMDGIAIHSSSFKEGNRLFPIEGIQLAGSPQQKLESPSNCFEVMTGAVLPEGTDTVIRYEDLTVADKVATINLDLIDKGQNIHNQGSDALKDDMVLSRGKQLDSADISILATVGKNEVSVLALPKVVVISTGDELVDVHEEPKEFQIRRSNTYTLLAELGKLGIDAANRHYVDDKEILKTNIAELLESFDVLIFSGGVSRGKKDYLPEVLEELEVEKHFHRIAQRPGKPMWFGSNASKKIVFGFPGNPVSVFVCFKTYFLDWFYASNRLNRNLPTAELTEDVNFKPSLSFHVSVKLKNKNGRLMATPIHSGGSGDLMTLANLEGFLTLPEGQELYEKGTNFQLIT